MVHTIRRRFHDNAKKHHQKCDPGENNCVLYRVVSTCCGNLPIVTTGPDYKACDRNHDTILTARVALSASRAFGTWTAGGLALLPPILLATGCPPLSQTPPPRCVPPSVLRASWVAFGRTVPGHLHRCTVSARSQSWETTAIRHAH